VPGRSSEAIEHLEVALAKQPDLEQVRALLSQLREGHRRERKTKEE